MTSGTLAAFVNGELRGVQAISTGSENQVFVGPYAGANVFFLIIYADTNSEVVSFYYADGSGSTVHLGETIACASAVLDLGTSGLRLEPTNALLATLTSPNRYPCAQSLVTRQSVTWDRRRSSQVLLLARRCHRLLARHQRYRHHLWARP